MSAFPRDIHGHKLVAAPFKCETCGREFSPTEKDAKRRNTRFCSHGCHGISRRGHAPACVESFITPISTKAERIRANGLINKRLKLGWFIKPTACMKCGAKVKLDSHHFDYSKKDEVLWLCRGCHMTAHQRPEFVADISPMKCDRQDGKPVGYGRTHSGGGRKGSTGKAKGRLPLRRIVTRAIDGEKVIEGLACGHAFIRAYDDRRPVQRRCPSCPRLSSPSSKGGALR